jgi:hypothetical protein
LLLASLREPPQTGSLQESILLLYVLKKEQIEHARLRALAQAIVAKDKGKEVFDDYMRTAFPWLEAQKKNTHTEVIKALNAEVQRGGLGIKPLWQATKMHSRLKTKIVEKNAVDTPESQARRSAIYAKLGKMIPT